MYERRYRAPVCSRGFFKLLTFVECVLLLLLIILGGLSLSHENIRYELCIAQLSMSVTCAFIKLLYELLRESQKDEYRFVDDADLEMTGAPNYAERKRNEPRHD